jgi:hypothetical protein
VTDSLEHQKADEKSELTISIFGAFANEYIHGNKPKFWNERHVAQREMILGETYCRTIRAKRINEIDTDAVLCVLQPIWSKVREPASR